MQDFARHCWFLSGPTAGGKTSVGIELAHRLGAEIISMDSMALYRGMDIGTAKPNAAEREMARHHLIDVVDPHEDYSVAEYIEAAGSAADGILGRGRQVLFIGGTPLYLKSLLRGIFDGPPANWEVRERLEQEAAELGSESLHRRLTEVDAIAAARLHPRDTRRLIRALEVHQTTGKPISQSQTQFERGHSPDDCRVFVLDWPREQLYERINRRVDAMFASGLVEEIRRLLDRGKPLSRTAGQAVGYREVVEYLRGERDLRNTVELVKTRTRQFAKRQLTWFRSLTECRMVKVEEPFQAGEIANRIAAEGQVSACSFPIS